MIPPQHEKDEAWEIYSMRISMILFCLLTSIVYLVMTIYCFSYNDLSCSSNFKLPKFILLALMATWIGHPIIFAACIYHIVTKEENPEEKEDHYFKLLLFFESAMLALTMTFGVVLYNTSQCPPMNFPETDFSKYVSIATNIKDVGSAATICSGISLFLNIILSHFVE